MQQDGLIQLLPPRGQRPQTRIEITTKTAPQGAIDLPVHALPDLDLRLVSADANSRLWNKFIHRYHYLGYQPPSGVQLRYWVYAGDRLVALISFGAAWMCAPRDQFIGWNHEQRQQNLHRVANNARFLILPWANSKNLASKILGLTARQLPQDWRHRYGYRHVGLETFVEQARFTGVCYRAANWNHVGQTKGRGNLGPSDKISVPIKDVWLYPLEKKFKSGLICQ